MLPYTNPWASHGHLHSHAVVCSWWAGAKVMLLVMILTIEEWQEQTVCTVNTWYMQKITLCCKRLLCVCQGTQWRGLGMQSMCAQVQDSKFLLLKLWRCMCFDD